MEKYLSDLYTMSTYAIKAPSSHNTQPWIILLRTTAWKFIQILGTLYLWLTTRIESYI